jgi:hypothetical protein
MPLPALPLSPPLAMEPAAPSLPMSTSPPPKMQPLAPTNESITQATSGVDSALREVIFLILGFL